MAGWRIPLFSTSFGPEEEAAVLRPLRAGWLTMGEEVLRLEDDLRELTGARHAIALANCTAALHLACVALGLKADDEVLCPSLTFVASANAPRAAGATVRLCDIESLDDWTVSPAALEAAMGRSTKVIMAVHYAGFACQMEAILRLAEARGVAVIEDCAHALFTQHRGQTLGTFGRAGCFSFYSNKNATCGEGGALVTNDDILAEHVRLLRSHGMTQPTLDRHRGIAFSYDVALPGFNYRLDEIHAALIRAQLHRLPGYLNRRRELFGYYAERLRNTPVSLPFTTGRFPAELATTGVHILPVLLPPGVERRDVMERMKAQGIQTSIHYPPIHRFKAYQNGNDTLEVTDDVASREVTLPFFPAMRDADVTSVVDALAAAVENSAVNSNR
jgi:dTDP-4-amino-4,6-dideoxygalactose transaminase